MERKPAEFSRPPWPARMSFRLLLVVVALAPLPFGANRPWAWSLLSLCVGCLVLLWGIGAAASPAAMPLPWGRYRPPFVLFALFVAWGLYQAVGPAPESWWAPGWHALAGGLGAPVSGAISTDPERTLTAIMRLLAYGGIFWLAMQVGRRTRYARMAIWSVVLAGTAYAIYGLIVQLQGSDTILWFRKWTFHGALTSTFVSRNHFAIYAGLAMLCALTLLADEARKSTETSLATRSGLHQLLDNMSMRVVTLAAAFVVLLASLLLTQSRAGTAATILAILVLLAMLASTSMFAAKSVVRFGLAILASTVVIAIVSAGMLATRMTNVVDNLSNRFVIYQGTLHAIAERPFLGFGLGSFPTVFPRFLGIATGANGEKYDYAHNVYLELAFGAGIPAALALVAAAGMALWVCVWGARRRHRNGFFPALGVAATALVGLHGLVDFSLQIPAIAATFCLILGVAYAQAWRTAPSGRWDPDSISTGP